ncbi:hypothetical protein PVW51_23845 [Sulfitobacter sp. PR48]|uniref:Uncharacterized protein n=1 Tax=Sulfitobacter porphyrae TaxID=1246864 RepID=A0ABW2B0Z5_9RHOB|nr:hypothetical protein [Sulfitobacter sp. PR48]MDD9723740.1 hypothetical protein [Sulfitobacter sp. PR48]GLT12286.1 hypothetical protein GCM10007928_45190 [Sulfitobacter porphyrae]
MISLYETTDATATYRETSALQTVKLDATADTGSLMGIMRDAVLVLGSPTPSSFDVKVPETPNGNLDAVAR